MAKAKWNLPNFNAIVNEYEVAKDELDDAAKECIQAGLTIQYNAMRDGLEPHRLTGAAIEALTKTPITKDGNKTSANVYIAGTRATDMNGFWAAWFQEYGAKTESGKTLFKKDPWFRPAIDKNKALIESFWRAIFDKRGFPMK